MRTRDEVLREFSRPYQSHEDVGGPDADAMADRIRELEERVATVDAEREQAYQVAQQNEQTARRLNDTAKILSQQLVAASWVVEAARAAVADCSCGSMDLESAVRALDATPTPGER